MGGLGNQLFEYAFARSYGARHGREVLFDTSLYDSGESDYPLDLRNFCVQLPLAHQRDVERLKDDGRSFFDKVFGRLFGKEHSLKGPCIREPSFRFSRRVIEQRRDELFFVGYWQSEKYFSSVAAELRKELVLRAEPSARVRSLRERIAGAATVSVHVRRGDYVRNPMFKSIYRTIGSDYYLAAYESVVRASGPTLPVIFSDDADWARAELRLSRDQVVVDSAPGCAAEDMVMMSQCNHHIIANSTYSWWGAWLDPGIGKTVISPKEWFHKGHYSMRDLLPETWLRI